MSNELRVILKQERLEITCRFTRDQSPVALCLKSDRSKQITKESDVSDRAPDQQKHQGRRIMAGSNCELWFPVVDVGLLPGMYAHMKYTGTSEGTWSMNGFGLHGDVNPSSPDHCSRRGAGELGKYRSRDMNGAITDFSLRYPLRSRRIVPVASGGWAPRGPEDLSSREKMGGNSHGLESVSASQGCSSTLKVEPLGLTASQVRRVSKAVEYRAVEERQSEQNT